MHPLFDNMKHLTFEELEKKNVEINKRMQMYARSQTHNPEIWDQLEQMREAIFLEKQERAMKLNRDATDTQTHVAINTDPIEGDEPTKPTVKTGNRFNPIS